MNAPMKVAQVTLENTTYSDGTFDLMFGQYEHDGSLAIMLQTLDGEPQATVTVLVDEPAPKGTFWVKHWSENEGIPQALEKEGVIVPTGAVTVSGFVAPLGYKLAEPYATVAAEYLKEG